MVGAKMVKLANEAETNLRKDASSFAELLLAISLHPKLATLDADFTKFLQEFLGRFEVFPLEISMDPAVFADKFAMWLFKALRFETNINIRDLVKANESFDIVTESVSVCLKAFIRNEISVKGRPEWLRSIIYMIKMACFHQLFVLYSQLDDRTKVITRLKDWFF